MKINIKEASDIYWKLTKEIGHEPSAGELDRCGYNLSARYIQRNLGGLVEFRKKIGSKEVNQTVGKKRSDSMKMASINSKKYERDLFMKICNKYSSNDVMVLREYCYQQYAHSNLDSWYKNTFADTAIIYDKHIDLFDFFNPVDMASFDGCIRIKLKKVISNPIALRPGVSYSLYFVCINPNIDQKMIAGSVLNKKGVELLSLDTFNKRFL